MRVLGRASRPQRSSPTWGLKGSMAIRFGCFRPGRPLKARARKKAPVFSGMFWIEAVLEGTSSVTVGQI